MLFDFTELPAEARYKLLASTVVPRPIAWVVTQSAAMHVRDDAVLDAVKHYIDTPKLDLIGRMHGRGGYATTRDQFQIARIPFDQWDEEAG